LEEKIKGYKGSQKAIFGDSREMISISAEGLELIEHLSVDCSASEGAFQPHLTAEIDIDKFGYITRGGIKPDAKNKRFWDGTIVSDRKPLRLRVRNIGGDELIINV
jgi:adenine-specific DNA-methyltransferase